VCGVQAPPTIFSQINCALHPEEFSRGVKLFPTPRATRGLTEYDQFLALCFGQLTYRESLRDIVTCLRARPSLLYRLGFRGNISRTNLAYANQQRDCRLFEAVAQVLMRRAAHLYQDHPTGPGSTPSRIRAGFLNHFSVPEFVPLGLLRTLQTCGAQVAFNAVFTG